MPKTKKPRLKEYKARTFTLVPKLASEEQRYLWDLNDFVKNRLEYANTKNPKKNISFINERSSLDRAIIINPENGNALIIPNATKVINIYPTDLIVRGGLDHIIQTRDIDEIKDENKNVTFYDPHEKIDKRSAYDQAMTNIEKLKGKGFEYTKAEWERMNADPKYTHQHWRDELGNNLTEEYATLVRSESYLKELKSINFKSLKITKPIRTANGTGKIMEIGKINSGSTLYGDSPHLSGKFIGELEQLNIFQQIGKYIRENYIQ